MQIVRKTFIPLFLIVLCITVLSCSNKAKEEVFAERLNDIDSYILEGNTKKALKKLNSLAKKAVTDKNYISVAKRQLKLKAVSNAVITLQRGLKQMPASPELSAVLISVLIEAGKAPEALPYCRNVEHTIYAGLGAEAYVLSDMASMTLTSPYNLLKSAYDMTGEQAFLKNAALVLARKGQIQEAAQLRNLISEETAPEDPYFWSCLSYDIGRFEPVFSDLYFALVYADKDGGFGKSAEAARRHLLLAADAAFGQGDMERARAFWQAAADRSPEKSPIVFYDLALTAPDEKERVDLLLECIDRYPAYYPVIAQYIREYMAIRAAAQPDDVTAYLEQRGFYSLEMENTYFTSPKMTYTPEELLSRVMAQKDFDPRFILEDFRYRLFKENTRDRSKAEMWKILEKYGSYPEVREYAKWYFSTFRDFDACFGIAELHNAADNAFYRGLSGCITGNLEGALTEFVTAALNPRNTYAVEANKAYIYYLQGKVDAAIETFSKAADLTPDKKKQSRLHYEAAVILSQRKAVERAISVLGRALDLDPQNYPAAVLLKRLTDTR